MELETRIETKQRYCAVFVDTYEEDVWLNLVVESARCHVTLTKDQAKDLIAALIRIVDAEVTK